jgi:hypothetical protein
MMSPATAACRLIGHDPSPFILSGLLAQCRLHFLKTDGSAEYYREPVGTMKAIRKRLKQAGQLAAGAVEAPMLTTDSTGPFENGP